MKELDLKYQEPEEITEFFLNMLNEFVRVVC